MLNNVYRYVKNVIEIEKFLEDTGNRYLLISQRYFKGKYNAKGECEI